MWRRVFTMRVLAGSAVTMVVGVLACRGERGTGPPPDISFPWDVRIADLRSTPAVSEADNLAITATGGDAFGIGLTDGKIKWRSPLVLVEPAENVAVAGTVALVGNGAFRAISGQMVGIVPVGPRTNIVTDGSSFYFGGSIGRVHGVSATTGVVRWTAVISVSGFTVNGISVVGGRVFVCGNENQRGTLYALSADDGRILWSHTYAPAAPAATSACYGRSVSAAGAIISPQADGRVFAHDPATGAVRWVSPPLNTAPLGQGVGAGDSTFATAASSGLFVTTTSSTGTLVALDGNTGAILWRSGLPILPSGPAAAGRSYVAVNHSGVLAVYQASDGVLVRRYPEESAVLRPVVRGLPAILGDVLFFVDDDGLHARELP